MGEFCRSLSYNLTSTAIKLQQRGSFIERKNLFLNAMLAGTSTRHVLGFHIIALIQKFGQCHCI